MMFKTIVFFFYKTIAHFDKLKIQRINNKTNVFGRVIKVKRIFPIIIKSLSDKQNRIPSYL